MKWDGGTERAKYKKFHPRHVYALREMVRRNLSIPHEFFCITDEPDALPPEIRAIKLPPHFEQLGGTFPKLALFSHDNVKQLGDGFLFLDLDSCITDSLDPLIPQNTVDFKIAAKKQRYGMWELLRSTRKRRNRAFFRSGYRFNSAIMYVRAASLGAVLEGFEETKARQIQSYYFVNGDDQVWLQHRLNDRAQIWTTEDGIYSYASLGKKKRATKPANARVINFGGSYAPWRDDVLQMSPWIRDYYPLDLLSG